MKYPEKISMTVVILGAVSFGSAYAQKVYEFPSRDNPLHARIEGLNALRRTTHRY